MGRDPRPIAARNRMMRAWILPLALLAGGCGGHANVQLSSGGSSAGVHGSSSAGTLIGIGVLGAIMYAESDDGGIRYRASPFDAIGPARPAPQLDPARRVLEQDCSQPIEDWSANLRCR